MTIDELELRPVDGFPRWLGRRLARAVPAPGQHGGERRRRRWRGWSRRPPATSAATATCTPRSTRSTYRLRITGLAAPRTLTLADLQALPRETRVCVQECAGNGNHIMGSAGLCGQAVWSGPTFESLLELCGGPGDATHFAFHGLDDLGVLKRGYHYGLSLDELRRAGAIVALTMNGEPLSRRHGFPSRLIVPQIYSMSHVKWLGHIEGKTRPHMGIHNRLVFTNKELRAGKWVRVQARWIGLKSIDRPLPPRRRPAGCSPAAPGAAAPRRRVEVSTDGGLSWQPARLQSPAEYFREHPDVPPERPPRRRLVGVHLPLAPARPRHLQARLPRDRRHGAVQLLDNDPEGPRPLQPDPGEVAHGPRARAAQPAARARPAARSHRDDAGRRCSPAREAAMPSSYHGTHSCAGAPGRCSASQAAVRAAAAVPLTQSGTVSWPAQNRP
jgi:DMSO/TMAO reductase YedYZ molybdopterin-dependent catalytic subunit